MVGAVSANVQYLGALSGTLNLIAYFGAKTGVVGRIALKLTAGSSLFGGNVLRLDGDFVVQLNLTTANADETIQTFLIGSDGKLLKNADGSLRVGSTTIHPGFSLALAGTVVIANTLTFDGRFTFDLDTLRGRLTVTVAATMSLSPFGSLAAAGALQIDSSGIVLYASLTMSASFGGNLGLSFSASATVAVNTTGHDVSFDLGQSSPVTVHNGIKLRIDGRVDFLGFAGGNGFAEIAIDSSSITVQFGLSFYLAGLIFSANGSAGVYTGSDPGLVLSLNVHATMDASVIFIDAAGTLQINTTGTNRLGVTSHTFVLALTGTVKILAVLNFQTGFSVVVRNGGWRVDFFAHIDFFGIVQIDGTGFFDSNGNFDITLTGGFQIGSDSFGLSGSATFHIWNNTTFDTVGNAVYDFGLTISAHMDAHLFGISIAGVGISASFTAHGNGTVKIEMSVTVHVSFLFVSFDKTMSFTIGYLELPRPVFLAGSSTDRQGWRPGVDHDLYLNVGSHKGSRNIGTGDDNEAYTIKNVGFDDQGRTLTQVSAFGRTNTYADVRHIYANFGDGNLSLWRDATDIVATDPYPMFGAEPAGGYNHTQVQLALHRDGLALSTPSAVPLEQS